MDDPLLHGFYEEAARKTKRVAFRVAVSDYMLRPVVEVIDLFAYTGATGDVITIEACDDRHVAAVSIRLTDDAGAVLEEGAAERDPFDRWIYTATVSVPSETIVRMEVTAKDLPGNAHTAVEEMQVRGPGELPALPPADGVRQAEGIESVRQDVPERDVVVASLARIRELLQGRDHGLTALPVSRVRDCPQENVRLALELLLQAEQLLRTPVVRG